MRGLYAILDVAILSARRIHPLAFAGAVLSVRPAALQLRAKDLSSREILALLRSLGPLCRAARVPLVCNDRADLASLAGCGLVHLGQDDASIDLVRRLSPELQVGLSTHTPDQLARALLLRPAYVAYGPVFPTESKPDASPVVGLDGLRVAAALAREAGIPLVAIGGIDLARAPEVRKLAPAAASIGYLVPLEAHEIADRASALHAALGGGAREDGAFMAQREPSS